MIGNKLIIGVSDAIVSDNHQDTLITYSLGSCIGVCAYDSVVSVGGLLHYQLPNASIDIQKANQNPFMFADSGMKVLVDKMLSMGAVKKRIQVKIAGGANMDTGPKGFEIGKRNYLSIRKILWQNGMFIAAEDCGGSWPRTMSMNITDGLVKIKANGSENQL